MSSEPQTEPRAGVVSTALLGSVLDRLYSAHGTTAEGEPDMRWTVDLDARVLEIDVGRRMLRLDRSEAMALVECLNAALPHMAVRF